MRLEQDRKYSTFQNVVFSHRYLLQGGGACYFLQASLSVLGSIAAAFMLTYLPSLAIRILADGAGLLTIVLELGSFMAVLCLVTIFYKRVESTSNAQINAVRMRKIEDYYHTLAAIRYEKLDTSADRKLFDAGLSSYYDGFHTGFHKAIFDTRTLILNLIGLLLYCGCIARLDPVIAVFFAAVSMLSVLFNHWFEQWVKRNEKNWHTVDTNIKYLCKESTALKNAKEIRLYAMQDWFLDRMQTLDRERGFWDQQEQRRLLGVRLAGRLLTAVKYFVAYFAVFAAVLQGLPASEFVFAIGLILGVNNWVTGIFDSVQFLQLNSIHIGNSRKVLEMASPGKEEKRRLVPDAPPMQGGKIELRDVTFAFPEAEKPIFEGLDLTISPGEKVAIVGNNGAGKSTLVNLICGLYTPTQGSVLLDGVAASRKEAPRCAAVFQEIHLLAATVLENVSCLPEEDSDPVRAWECFEKAGLKEKIGSLPRGIHSRMLKELDGEGVVLSGGEAQKLMLARCLYQNCPVLILDEPTAALDAIAESEIYQRYQELTKGKTSIFISHRLSSTKFCDRILLLDQGRIVEEGTHAQLLEKQGAYAKMYAMQSSYYREEAQ